ncbi:MAG TPA: hypothetical protein VFA82_06860 [Gaiellaceae bacterium]|nr:hypothetical protein [Gaiellaceae bacterium]
MPAPLEQSLARIVELRRIREASTDPETRRRLGPVIREVRLGLPAGVPKRRAAAMLGISVQALDRWIGAGALPTLRRPGSARTLVDTEALLLVVAETEALRERGEGQRPAGRAIRRLQADGRLPRKLRPNQSAAELRTEFRRTTPAGRLREAVELSELGARLASRRDGE